MARPPLMDGRSVAKVFETFGWEVARHGNHIIMVRPGENVSLSIPNHKEVSRGTLHDPIRTAGLTVAEFVAAI